MTTRTDALRAFSPDIRRVFLTMESENLSPQTAGPLADTPAGNVADFAFKMQTLALALGPGIFPFFSPTCEKVFDLAF